MWLTDEEFAKLDKHTLDVILDRLHNKTIESTLCLMPEIIVGLITNSKGVDTALKAFKQKYPSFADADIAKAVEAIEMLDGAQNLEEILLKVPAKIKSMQVETPEAPIKTVAEAEEAINGFI